MCAIAGGINVGEETIVRMLDLQNHRGPDDRGIYRSSENAVVLGHCRLAIIDLTSAGHQPMTSSDGSLVIVFNGEIYNYKELTKELKERGQVFHSNSDTEVILNGYAEYGEDIFKKIDGMWALALYDTRAGKLLLSRDPAGMKPLYIYKTVDSFFFSSELGALSGVLPPHARTLKQDSLKRFLAHGYLYGAETIYTDISRVPAGQVLTYTLPGFEARTQTIYTPSKRFVIKNMEEAVAKFDELFSESVRNTLQSDVPVGLFLSGGIDSALAGYHIKAAGSELAAFTVGFAEQAFDESIVASRIAKHLGFPHTTFVMSGNDVAAEIEHILDSFGEPFADTSILPTYFLSKLARESGVKVAIGGDGADELFGGYPTHYLPYLADVYRHTPISTDVVLRHIATLLPGHFTKLGHREKITRFVNSARNPYAQAHSQWRRVFTDDELRMLLTADSDLGSSLSDLSFNDVFTQVHPSSKNSIDEIMKVDFYTFLPGSCLVKSDIASMQHGLEVRLPFLNKDIIDFAWDLPTKFKVGPFSTKRLLRNALAKHLPPDIAHMKKQGFVPPLAQWLTRELKPVMLSILSAEHVAQTGFLEYKYIVSLIDDHLACRVDNSKKIWALMSLVRFHNSNA